MQEGSKDEQADNQENNEELWDPHAGSWAGRLPMPDHIRDAARQKAANNDARRRSSYIAPAPATGGQTPGGARRRSRKQATRRTEEHRKPCKMDLIPYPRFYSLEIAKQTGFYDLIMCGREPGKGLEKIYVDDMLHDGWYYYQFSDYVRRYIERFGDDDSKELKQIKLIAKRYGRMFRSSSKIFDELRQERIKKEEREAEARRARAFGPKKRRAVWKQPVSVVIADVPELKKMLKWHERNQYYGLDEIRGN